MGRETDDRLTGDAPARAGGVFRLRSGTAAAPVDQSAGRVIRLHVRRL